MMTDDLRRDLGRLADAYTPSTSRLYDRALATARRTRTSRVAASAAAVAVLVVFAVTVTLRSAPAPTGPAIANAAPPTATTGATSSAPARIGTGPLVPQGAIDLTNEVLTLPHTAFDMPPCEGRVALTQGRGTLSFAQRSTVDIGIAQEWVGDITRDGVPDTLALVTCTLNTIPNWQLLAYRGGAGVPLSLGQVIAIGDQPQLPARLFGLTVTPAGDIVADLGDYYGDDTPTGLQASAVISTHQLRTYHYTDTRFIQVAGPTQFPPNPRVYRLAFGPTMMTFGPGTGGSRSIIITVQLSNTGLGAAADATVRLAYPGAATPAGGDWDVCHPTASDAGFTLVRCALGRIPGGSSRTVRLLLTAPAATRPDAPGRADLTTVYAGATDDFGFGLALDPAAHEQRLTITYV